MGNQIFGTPKLPEPTPRPPSTQEQISVLEKRKAHLEHLIEINHQKALDSKTKDEATRYLKLKIMYTKELKSIFGMIEKLELLDSARQQLLIQKSTLKVTEYATNVIKNTTIDPDKAEDVMFEVHEALANADRVNEVFTRSDPPSDELQAELDALFEKKPEPQPVIVKLPDVPITTTESSVDKELRMLVAS